MLQTWATVWQLPYQQVVEQKVFINWPQEYMRNAWTQFCRPTVWKKCPFTQMEIAFFKQQRSISATTPATVFVSPSAST
jgi:hypothetical protein